MSNRETLLTLTWASFIYEVNRATSSLMYLLQGMETVRNRELTPYNRLPPLQQMDTACAPKLSYVDMQLSMSGICFDPSDVLKREGEAEQLAFKGWVEQVYFLWESRFRNEIKKNLEGPDVIYPEGDAIGDFRLIRNDLIHNNGVASYEKSGKCILLKWFKPGEKIILEMRHIFDFLNQMGFMKTEPVSSIQRGQIAWTAFLGKEDMLVKRPVPKLVSIRKEMIKEMADGSSWHAVMIVFENGVFANIPVEYPSDGSSLPDRIELISKTCIDNNGNLRFANGLVKDRESLYQEAIHTLLGMGPNIEGLGGVPGPAFRFKR